MTDILATLGAVAASIVWIVLSHAAYVRLNGYRKRRLLRCPESTGIVVVDVVENRQSRSLTDRGVLLKVEHCQLWPERANCGRGCLTRCSRTWGGYGFDLSSLMPFDNHDLKQHVSAPH